MSYLKLSDVSLAFGARDILSNVHLHLSHQSRAALAGINGSGKTTLMKIACGIQQADKGNIIITKNCSSAYLAQVWTGITTDYDKSSIMQVAESAFLPLQQLVVRQDILTGYLATTTQDDSQTTTWLQELGFIQEQLDAKFYYHRETQIAEVLEGLGFSKRQWADPISSLSGGWKMRVLLAKLLLEKADFLFLDEPTNYLDIEARNWLEDYLKNYNGGILLVSHDRYFMDTLVNEVYELWEGTLNLYPGTYSNYEKRRLEESSSLLAAWQRQQEEIERQESFIRRFRYKASKASQVQSRIKQLDKIELITLPENLKPIRLHIPNPPHSGKISVKIKNVCKSYANLAVLRNAHLEVSLGTKLALVGPNGAGKSTLMRLLAGKDSDYQGEIVFGTGVKVAYFSQDSADAMTGNSTIESEIEAICPIEIIPRLRNLLGAFLFRGDDIYKKISVLSGGEKSRLALLKILLQPANLLLLDEPTNHLDLVTKDILLESLLQYKGSLIFVSHDRHFITRLADRVLLLERGASPLFFHGGYEYYLTKKASLDAGDEENPDAHTRGGKSGSLTSSASPEGEGNGKFALQAENKNSIDKGKLKKLKAQENQIIERLDAIAQERSATEQEMSQESAYKNGNRMKELNKLLTALEAEEKSLHKEWEATSLALQTSLQ